MSRVNLASSKEKKNQTYPTMSETRHQPKTTPTPWSSPLPPPAPTRPLIHRRAFHLLLFGHCSQASPAPQPRPQAEAQPRSPRLPRGGARPIPPRTRVHAPPRAHLRRARHRRRLARPRRWPGTWTDPGSRWTCRRSTACSGCAWPAGCSRRRGMCSRECLFGPRSRGGP
jgi:hypothetical protein